jgi:dolichyl-phosphate beta-glucosyltransferase
MLAVFLGHGNCLWISSGANSEFRTGDAMIKQTNSSLTVVIPSFNESRRISSTIHTLKRYLEQHAIPHELLIVDDGSTDETLSLAQSAAREWQDIVVLSVATNHGKGFAVREGMLRATRDVVLFTDADLSTPVEEIEPILRQIKAGFDVVIGSRKTQGSKVIVRQPRFREWLGSGYSWLANHVTGAGVTDFTCGFKAFRLKAAQDIFTRQRLNSWSFDAEVLFLARKRGFRLSEIPVQWRNDAESKVRVIRDVFRSFSGLILVRIYDILGRYN